MYAMLAKERLDPTMELFRRGLNRLHDVFSVLEMYFTLNTGIAQEGASWLRRRLIGSDRAFSTPEDVSRVYSPAWVRERSLPSFVCSEYTALADKNGNDPS